MWNYFYAVSKCTACILEQCLEYLGDTFRVVLGVPEDWNNRAIGAWLFQKIVQVCLDEPRNKFRMLM